MEVGASVGENTVPPTHKTTANATRPPGGHPGPARRGRQGSHQSPFRQGGGGRGMLPPNHGPPQRSRGAKGAFGRGRGGNYGNVGHNQHLPPPYVNPRDSQGYPPFAPYEQQNYYSNTLAIQDMELIHTMHMILRMDLDLIT